MRPRYERVVLRRDVLAPHAAAGVLDACPWPGTAGRPVPLLTYPPTVYFGRLVALALDAGPRPVHGRVAAECDMSDVLRNLALAGQGGGVAAGVHERGDRIAAGWAMAGGMWR